MNRTLNIIIRTFSIILRILSCVPAIIVFLYGLMGAIGMSFAGAISDFYIQLLALMLCVSGGISLVFALIKLSPKQFRFLLLYQGIFFILLSILILKPIIAEKDYSTDLLHYMAAFAVLANISLITNFQREGSNTYKAHDCQEKKGRLSDS